MTEVRKARPDFAGGRLLKAGAVSSASIAILHVGILIAGAPAFRYFGAGERMAQMAERGSLAPSVWTIAITVVFLVWTLFALSGAGVLRRLPLLRTGLVAVAAVYTLRGLVLGPQLVWFLSGYTDAVPPRYLLFSAASLLAGLIHIAGTHRAWRALDPSIQVSVQ